MSFLLILFFGLIAAIGAAFVALPLLRRAETSPSGAPKVWQAAIAALLVAGIGLGAYFALGQPQLALRSLAGPEPNDFTALVATLASRMHEHPDDAQGWALLGRGYLALGDFGEAAKALARAVELAKAKGQVPASLLSAYGEALTGAAGGTVPSEAEAAFREALASDPHEAGASYYLGLAERARGHTSETLKLWEGLLTDAPANAPWRTQLIDQVAALKAAQIQNGTAQAPDIAAMVQGLAARLAANPNDFEGWTRLIRAYAVLGDSAKAKDALARARVVFAKDSNAQTALAALARELALDRG